jgi:sulfate permease, SulP family
VEGEGGDEVHVDRDTVVFRISGAFFFGAAATVAAALDRIAERPRNYVLDFAAVGMIDSTAATTVAGFVRKQRRRQARVFITGAAIPVRRELLVHGVREPEVKFLPDVATAVEECRASPTAAETP